MAWNYNLGRPNDLNVADGSRKYSKSRHSLTVDGLALGVNLDEIRSQLVVTMGAR